MALDRLTKVDGGGISTTSDYRVGVITASKFVGPIDGVVTGSLTGTATTAVNAQGLTGTPDIVVGILTASSANFSGNVSIGGTLTYEDVTNIDSVGIITARDGLKVLDGGANIVGVVTATGADINGDIDVDGHTNLDNLSVAGVTTFASSIHVADSIIHEGDTDTKIDFDGNRIKLTAGNKLYGDIGLSAYNWFYTATNFVANSSSPKPSTYIARFRDEEGDDMEVQFFNTNVKNSILTWNDTGNTTAAGNLIFKGIAGGSGLEHARFTGSGNFNLLRDLDVDGHTNLDNLSVAGVTTFSSKTHVGTGITFHTNGNGEFAGIVTFTNYAHFPTNKRAVFGATSLYGSIYNEGSNLTFEALNQYTFKCWNGGGMQTWLYVNGISGNVDIGGYNLGNNGSKQPRLRVQGHTVQQILMHSSDGTNLTERFRLSQSGFNFTGLSTHTGNFDLDGDLDVDGHTNLDNVSIAGVTTMSGNLNVTGGANFTKSSNNYILVGSTNASGASLVLDGDSNGDASGTDYAYLTHNTDGDLEIVVDNPTNAGNIKFFTNSSSERLRITSSGTVNIGGNYGETANLFALDTNYEGFPSDSSQPEAILLIKGRGSNNRYVGIGASNTGSWIQASGPGYSGPTSDFSINPAGGKVAIGHQSPNTNLDIFATPLNTATLSTTNCKQLGLLVTPGGTGSNTTGHIYTGVAVGDGYAGLYGVDAGASAATHLAFFTGSVSAVAERLRIDSGGSVSIGDAATHTYSAHSEGDDLVVGGAGWRGLTIYGEGGGGVIQFADNGDNRIGQILYYHAENSMSFRVNGNQTRLKIDSNGDVCIGNSGNPPWTETGGNYNNISLCGNDASSSGFLNLGNGAAATNADFDLARIKIHNGATEVARITTTTATSDSGDGHLKFFTKKAGAGLKEVLRIRNDGFIETMYEENQQSYATNISPTPCIRARNNRPGNGIYAGIQLFNTRSSGAASVADIGVVNDASTDYVSYLTFTTRNSDTTYSEKIRIDDQGQLRYRYADNGKHAFAVRSQQRTITGHSSTGYQYVRCALLSARTAYRFCISTRGGNYGPGAQFFTALRSWDSTTFYVTDKFNMGSAYANAVRMQSDNGGSTWYLEVSINLNTTSQGFDLCIIPIGGNAGDMTTTLQYYGSGMSNLANTSSAQSL